jgi:hypothetical protein
MELQCKHEIHLYFLYTYMCLKSMHIAEVNLMQSKKMCKKQSFMVWNFLPIGVMSVLTKFWRL